MQNILKDFLTSDIEISHGATAMQKIDKTGYLPLPFPLEMGGRGKDEEGESEGKGRRKEMERREGGGLAPDLKS